MVHEAGCAPRGREGLCQHDGVGWVSAGHPLFLRLLRSVAQVPFKESWWPGALITVTVAVFLPEEHSYVFWDYLGGNSSSKFSFPHGIYNFQLQGLSGSIRGPLMLFLKAWNPDPCLVSSR